MEHDKAIYVTVRSVSDALKHEHDAGILTN